MTSPKAATGASFATQIPRRGKASRGRTGAAQTPLHIRAADVPLEPSLRTWIQERTMRQLGKFASHVERISLRFEDVNGPRGGRDTVCRAKIALSGLPSIVVEQRARTARTAFDLVVASAGRALRKAVGRARPILADRETRGVSLPAAHRGRSPTRKSPHSAKSAQGSLIGRRVGRARENLLRAATRPEKERSDVPVDTALPGVSASDRKVGLRGTATRNTKLRRSGMTATLEDSATGKPSRKSTRKSQNRAKGGSKLARRTKRRLTSPQSRARRAAVRA
jgi:ribosome-associated translation inhibitor RaiA